MCDKLTGMDPAGKFWSVSWHEAPSLTNFAHKLGENFENLCIFIDFGALFQQSGYKFCKLYTPAPPPSPGPWTHACKLMVDSQSSYLVSQLLVMSIPKLSRSGYFPGLGTTTSRSGNQYFPRLGNNNMVLHEDKFIYLRYGTTKYTLLNELPFTAELAEYTTASGHTLRPAGTARDLGLNLSSDYTRHLDPSHL